MGHFLSQFNPGQWQCYTPPTQITQNCAYFTPNKNSRKKNFIQLEIATIGLLAGVHSINARIKNYDIWIALRLFLLFLSQTIQALFYKIYGEIL